MVRWEDATFSVEELGACIKRSRTYWLRINIPDPSRAG
jgi:hypothetical protein